MWTKSDLKLFYKGVFALRHTLGIKFSFLLTTKSHSLKGRLCAIQVGLL